MKWPRPDEFASGLVNGVMVLVSPFPPRDLFRNKYISGSEITWLRLPPYGKLLALVVIVARPDVTAFLSKQKGLDKHRMAVEGLRYLRQR